MSPGNEGNMGTGAASRKRKTGSEGAFGVGTADFGFESACLPGLRTRFSACGRTSASCGEPGPVAGRCGGAAAPDPCHADYGTQGMPITTE